MTPEQENLERLKLLFDRASKEEARARDEYYRALLPYLEQGGEAPPLSPSPEWLRAFLDKNYAEANRLTRERWGSRD